MGEWRARAAAAYRGVFSGLGSCIPGFVLVLGAIYGVTILGGWSEQQRRTGVMLAAIGAYAAVWFVYLLGRGVWRVWRGQPFVAPPPRPTEDPGRIPNRAPIVTLDEPPHDPSPPPPASPTPRDRSRHHDPGARRSSLAGHRIASS